MGSLNAAMTLATEQIDERIILVDDNPDDLLLFQRALTRGGRRSISTFAHPQKAVDFLRTLETAGGENPPGNTWVFCDLKMPELDGFAVLDWIRRQPYLAAVRFIMVSGCALQEDVERARNLGADGYIEKTPSARALLQCLQSPSFPATGTRWERFRAWSAEHE